HVDLSPFLHDALPIFPPQAGHSTRCLRDHRRSHFQGIRIPWFSLSLQLYPFPYESAPFDFWMDGGWRNTKSPRTTIDDCHPGTSKARGSTPISVCTPLLYIVLFLSFTPFNVLSSHHP